MLHARIVEATSLGGRSTAPRSAGRPPRVPSLWGRLAAAVGAPAVAFALQVSTWKYLPPSPHLFFYPAVFAAAWFGGYASGVAATVLSSLAIAYEFLPPIGNLRITAPEDALDLAIFVALGFMMTVLIERGRRRTERHIVESSERFDRLFACEMLGVLLWEDHRIVDANDAFLRMTARPREDLSLGEIERCGVVAAESSTPFKGALDEAMTTGASAPFEAELLRPSGDRLAVLIAAERFPSSTRSGVCFVLDISDRRRAAEETAHARALAEAARLRDDFLSMISHEIRTPLTAIHLHARRFVRMTEPNVAPLPAGTLRELATSIARSTRRIDNLVEHLSTSVSLGAGAFEPRPERMDVADVVRRLVEETKLDLPDSSLLVLRRAAPAFGTWDRRRVELIVSNLLANALKYGRRNPVEVAVDVLDDAVRVSITDTGIGISPDDLGRVFGRFERGVSSRNYSGFGLGLWVVDECARTIGAKVAITSAVGEGTTVVVTFPAAAAT